MKERDKAFTYAHETVGRWAEALREATGQAQPFSGKVVMELGPGADLAPGVLILKEGAEKYIGLDKHDLLVDVPEGWYRPLSEHFDEEKLTWIRDDAFRLAEIPAESIDIVVSNNAFEHFDHVAQTLRDVDRVLKPSGWLCAHVDLQTHTGAIRNADPFNIYRYPHSLYRLMKFPGIPNRVRPELYEQVLSALKWKHVTIAPVFKIADKDRKRFLHGVYRDVVPQNGRETWLSFLVIGQKD